jgi:hypothetical protein
MQLSGLQTAFPNKSKSKALTGLIPIDYYNSHKNELRTFIKENNYQMYFRGKRHGRALSTLKRDAHSVVIYSSPNNVIVDNDQWQLYSSKINNAISLFVGILLICASIMIGYISIHSDQASAFTACMTHSADSFFNSLNECSYGLKSK